MLSESSFVARKKSCEQRESATQESGVSYCNWDLPCVICSRIGSDDPLVVKGFPILLLLHVRRLKVFSVAPSGPSQDSSVNLCRLPQGSSVAPRGLPQGSSVAPCGLPPGLQYAYWPVRWLQQLHW